MNQASLTSVLLTSVLVTLPLTALSYQKGDLIVRAGAASVDPDDSSSLVTAGVLGPVANSGLNVDGDTQLGLTVSYMLSDHVAVELLASTPFSHDVNLQGNGIAGAVPSLPNATHMATIEHLPPTLSLQYFFLNPASKFQPYAGIGINYIIILDEDLSRKAESELGAKNLDVDNSIGRSFELGFDYQLNEHWLINASAWNIDFDTEASFDSAVGKVKADIDVDPWVYMLSIGYKF